MTEFGGEVEGEAGVAASRLTSSVDADNGVDSLNVRSRTNFAESSTIQDISRSVDSRANSINRSKSRRTSLKRTDSTETLTSSSRETADDSNRSAVGLVDGDVLTGLGRKVEGESSGASSGLTDSGETDGSESIGVRRRADIELRSTIVDIGSSVDDFVAGVISHREPRKTGESVASSRLTFRRRSAGERTDSSTRSTIIGITRDVSTSTGARIVVISARTVALESTDTVRASRHIFDTDRIRANIADSTTVLDVVGGKDGEGTGAGGVEEESRST